MLKILAALGMSKRILGFNNRGFPIMILPNDGLLTFQFVVTCNDIQHAFAFLDHNTGGTNIAWGLTFDHLNLPLM